MITLYNADCLDVLKTVKSESIDLVVTDPPYRTISGGNKSEKWKSGYSSSVLYKNDGKIFEYNSITFEEWIPEVYRVLKDGTHFYCMTNTINLCKIVEVATECGFYLHNILVWEKNTANTNRWYMKNCEYTLFFKKGRAKTINNPSSKTVHSFNNPIDKKHPTEKPVELMELYVSNSSNEGETVLDLFMGSGATGVACKNLNRNFIGVEISKEYYRIALQNINDVHNVETVKITKKKKLI